jgi:hypothetical protein
MKNWIAVASLGLLAGLVTSAVAEDDHGGHDRGNRVFRAQLVGLQEVPSVSTTASGRFYAIVNSDGTAFRYWLTFSNLTGATAQAHIHIGQHHVNGGISVWLCQGTARVPATAPPNVATDTPECTSTQPITGTIEANDLVGPAGQGIAANGAPEEFAELLAAMRAGVAYANVHSATFAGGEIRGQIH